MSTTNNATNTNNVHVESKSEVARLIQQIDDEVESGKRAIYAIAEGTARHEVITKRMERMGRFQEELQALIGDAALPVIIEKLDKLSNVSPT
jgi:hypothetical protein